MTPSVVVVMRMPVTIVTMMEVWRGRSPKSESFFLPTFEPRRSPIKAIAPPVMTRTRMSSTPYISMPPINTTTDDYREALRMRKSPAMSPTIFGIQTASIGESAPLLPMALAIVMRA